MPKGKKKSTSRTDQVHDEFLSCRTFGHRWGNSDVHIESHHYHESVLCRVCDTMRVDIWDRYGMKAKPRKYTYPDGYLIEGGQITAPERAELRVRKFTLQTR